VRVYQFRHPGDDLLFVSANVDKKN